MSDENAKLGETTDETTEENDVEAHALGGDFGRHGGKDSERERHGGKDSERERHGGKDS